MTEPRFTDAERAAMRAQMQARVREELARSKPGRVERGASAVQRLDRGVGRVARRVAGWSLIGVVASSLLLLIPIVGLLALVPLAACSVALVVSVVAWACTGFGGGSGDGTGIGGDFGAGGDFGGGM